MELSTAVVNHRSGRCAQEHVERNNASNVDQLLRGSLQCPVAQEIPRSGSCACTP